VPLSILHISQADAGGGSALSAARIHSGLKSLGHASRMLVGQRRTDSPDVRLLKRHAGWRALDRAVGTPLDRAGLQYVAYPSSFGVATDPWFRAADVVFLYNTHGSYFSHTALPLLTRSRPFVWRLSDMWSFTGHVAYAGDCERWRLGCGSCPYLEAYPALPRDTTALLWRIKRAVYRRSRLTLVAPSRWLARLAAESPLLGRFPVRHIPNGVDLDRFGPRDRGEARRQLGLDPERAVVLVSALDLSEQRKGAQLAAQAVRLLEGVDFNLVTAGEGTIDAGRPVRSLGRLQSDGMALAYAAADVFVLPALAENLPNAVLESLACGTPPVCFDVGGVGDAVRHLETGWLASQTTPRALAEGIRGLLEDDELRARIGRRAREVAETEYGAAREAAELAALAEELAVG
jgi:glycosyltransferase involved in cell wall biosynthesis